MKKLENNPMTNLLSQRKSVSVETITQSFNVIRIYLTDEGVNGTAEHLDQLEAILDATQNDVIEVYCLGCGGGSADSIIMLLNALAQSPAHTVTILEGHNASAASMPMMVTDEVRIGMYSSVMFHNVAGGVIGNMTNTAEAAKFYEQNYNRFFADLYNGFFSEEELSSIRQGREIYLDAESIQERLDKRREILAQECNCEECESEFIDLPEIVPPAKEEKTVKSTPRKRSTKK
jgi:ATP-dependent protease ClpP protease subunit